MAHYDTEDNNLAQQIEGFACGFDKNDDQYVLTPEDTEKDSEMNDSMYEESDTANPVPPPASAESDVDEPEVAPSSAPVAKSSGFCVYYWLVDPANRMKVLLGLALLVALVYFLHSQGMFTLPTVPSMPKLGLDSATSSFTGSSSLGKNVANMARNFQ